MGHGAWAWGMGHGHGAWGMGHGAWGMGHGAWGMGHGAWRMAHGKEFSVCSLAFLTMPNAQFADSFQNYWYRDGIWR
ncbi:hypothetical protein [Nostoc sp.]|uniref:hypothetical protein n=1 Tax=Nostoc sp. TaxID=1180 RepID=UPI002FF44593